jgi:hypothetical protein
MGMQIPIAALHLHVQQVRFALEEDQLLQGGTESYKGRCGRHSGRPTPDNRDFSGRPNLPLAKKRAGEVERTHLLRVNGNPRLETP